MDDIPSWHIVGDWFANCSCAVPAPAPRCRFESYCTRPMEPMHMAVFVRNCLRVARPA